ncbi:hypothetical protein EBR96_07880 [bacterium]|nr:hypothetical protein [bacterium]
MNTILKRIKSLGCFGVVVSIGCLLAPKPAHALIVGQVAFGGSGFRFESGSDAIMCVFILPICLLDQKISEGTAKQMTIEDLTENGYRLEDAKTILADQAKLSKILFQEKKVIVIKKDETRSVIAQQIREVFSKASEGDSPSESYIDFLFNNSRKEK